MFEDIVVQSAISAFNNAALFGPAFLWSAILSLPLFIVAFLYAKDFVARVGWNDGNLLSCVSVWVAAMVMVWGVLFGGNYAVLRDSVSVLPYVNSVIVFLASLFVVSHLRDRIDMIKRWHVLLILGIVFVVLTGLNTHWSWCLLLIGALLFGGLLGRFSRGKMRPIAGIVLIGFVTSCAILMQPEFYRFGQLGNLTFWHLGALLLLGALGMASIAVANINPGGKIGRSVYAKMKWLLRVIGILAAALFMLTEAVPVFIGAMVVLFVLFAVSVRFSKAINVGLLDKLFAAFLVMLGVITVMPVITVLGILYWVNSYSIDFRRDFRALL